jgi:hypothetical protein
LTATRNHHGAGLPRNPRFELMICKHLRTTTNFTGYGISSGILPSGNFS